MLFLGSISINCMAKTIVLNLFLCVPQKKVGWKDLKRYFSVNYQKQYHILLNISTYLKAGLEQSMWVERP